jgi:hypothetical protein
VAAERLAHHRARAHPDLESKGSGGIGKQFTGLIRYVAKVTDKREAGLYSRAIVIQNSNQTGDKP